MAAAGTPYASASLYIGDLAADVTEAILFEIFNAVGPVASVRVCRDAATRRSLGYAYVNFHRVDDAERALDTQNFKAIRGRPCRIMWSHRDPSLRKSGVGNIFVKNLAKSIDNKSLYDTFSMFGNILSCKVSINSKGESLGYGFVHYESEEAASNAINRVNGKLITGEKVVVSAFKSRKERGGNKFRFTNVYVKNLPLDMTKEKMNEMFGKYGPITSSMVPSQMGEDDKSKGFGFVNFKSPEHAAAAVEGLSGLELEEGKKLYVVRAQKKDERDKELRERFEQLKIERQKKYAGVNLYVKNLSDDVEDARLNEEFAKFGTITSAHVMKDENSGKTRGFGFVCFSTPEEATKAVTEMNGRMLNQKPLYVALAQRREVRRAQLEAQYAQRAKVGMPMPQPHVFPGGMPQVPGGPAPGPMFYQGVGVPQRNFVYPQQMMARQWNMSQPSGQAGGQTGAMQMRPPHPSVGYQLMAMNPQRPGGRGRGGQNNRVPGNRQNPQQVNKQQPQGQQQVQQQVAQPQQGGPLTAKALAEANDEQKKQMIGERLYPLIKAQQPEPPPLAGKITGMLLEMDNTELLHLLESPQALGEKIEEALEVLNDANSAAPEQ